MDDQLSWSMDQIVTWLVHDLTIDLSTSIVWRVNAHKTMFVVSLLWRSKRQPTHSLQCSAYPHQPYVDTLYVLPPRRRRPKLVLKGTSIPLFVVLYCSLSHSRSHGSSRNLSCPTNVRGGEKIAWRGLHDEPKRTPAYWSLHTHKKMAASPSARLQNGVWREDGRPCPIFRFWVNVHVERIIKLTWNYRYLPRNNTLFPLQ